MPLKLIASSEEISLDDVCYFCQSPAMDEIGNWIIPGSKRLCYCSELPVMSSEFFNAGKTGIRTAHTLLVDSESYAGETAVEYAGDVYSIYRFYCRASGYTELYLENKEGLK